jgi:tetratricopeptide (TPR) repeat protein
VSNSLLVDYYTQLPQLGPDDDPTQWKIRIQAANETYRKKAQDRYTEGTLLRLLQNGDLTGRRAAVLALGLMGTMTANKSLAQCLHHDDPELRQLAVNALWSLWFRGDTEAHAKDLQRLIRMRDRQKALAGLDNLIQKAPEFAEAFNQRAILAFRLKQFERSVSDCQRVLKLNPYHFGAQAGMAQCLMHLHRPKAALRAFRNALRTHPHMEGIAETIRALENALGEDRRRDDKK